MDNKDEMTTTKYVVPADTLTDEFLKEARGLAKEIGHVEKMKTENWKKFRETHWRKP